MQMLTPTVLGLPTATVPIRECVASTQIIKKLLLAPAVRQLAPKKRFVKCAIRHTATRQLTNTVLNGIMTQTNIGTNVLADTKQTLHLTQTLTTTASAILAIMQWAMLKIRAKI